MRSLLRFLFRFALLFMVIGAILVTYPRQLEKLAGKVWDAWEHRPFSCRADYTCVKNHE